jgi:hypothetical protein
MRKRRGEVTQKIWPTTADLRNVADATNTSRQGACVTNAEHIGPAALKRLQGCGYLLSADIKQRRTQQLPSALPWFKFA